MAGKKPRGKNLEGLLKFCVEGTAAEDPTTKSSFVENMDPERKAWLQEAISSFTNNDEVSLIKKCLEILSKPTGTLSSDEKDDLMTREHVLEQLETVVDIIDNAKDCYKLGGFQILFKYLDSSHTSLQWRAASVLGLCLQNNTYCQDQALQLNLMPKLLALVDSETSDEQVNVKSLYALACLIRGHSEAEKAFVMQNGFSYLLRALQRNIPKLTVKTIFLLSNLVEDKNEYLETLYNMGLVEQLVFIILRPHERYHEHVLNILANFAANYPAALQDCKREQYSLRETLNHRKKYLQNEDPDAFQDEIEQCDQLLELCFNEAMSDIQEATER